NGRLRSAERGRNLFRAAIRLVSFCTSLMDLGSSMFQRAFTLSGFASMPLVDTRHPSTFPLCTPKMHLLGFKDSPAFLRLAKVSARSATWLLLTELVTTISSTYARTFLLSWCSRTT